MITFTDSISYLIKQRYSVRTYQNRSLTPELIHQIKQAFQDVSTPFTVKPRFKFIEMSEFKNQSIKLGTYGMIKDAQYFVGVACEKSEFDLLAIGYAFEQLILYLTSQGLGTCWMGGTFNKTNFSKVMEVKENEIFPIVSPVGYEADKKRFIESLISRNSHHRLEFSKLFFKQNFETSLTESEAGDYFEALENVRLAPSALNKQPWRVVKQGADFHFYIDQEHHFKYIDLGIALCHFHLTMLEKVYDGTFNVQNPYLETNNHYVISWISAKN
ncbi:MAG: nitroreductase family protein [Turicibacter sp.]|nr:nitroreductase family protein [Turicibacter sp.]